MLPLWLVLAAFAQDTVDTRVTIPLPLGTALTVPKGSSTPNLLFPAQPPNLSKGIHNVPEGSLLLVRQSDGTYSPMTVAEKSWLLPDSYYIEAVTQAKQLEIVEPALKRCTDRALDWQNRTYVALDSCSEQFGQDEALINDLTGQVRTLETRSIVAEDKIRKTRNAAIIAWSITGGIFFGGIMTVAVAVNN